jgi:hypothetical protein
MNAPRWRHGKGFAISRRIVLAPATAAAVLVCALTGCADGTDRTVARSTGHARPRPARLAPSIPAVFTSGSNACGNPYAINATTTSGTIPLVDCPGLAGLQPTPAVTIPVGGRVLISGVPAHASLTVHPGGLLIRHSDLFTAMHAGRVTVTIHDVLCATGRPQARTCTLLTVSVL